MSVLQKANSSVMTVGPTTDLQEANKDL